MNYFEAFWVLKTTPLYPRGKAVTKQVLREITPEHFKDTFLGVAAPTPYTPPPPPLRGTCRLRLASKCHGVLLFLVIDVRISTYM